MVENTHNLKYTDVEVGEIAEYIRENQPVDRSEILETFDIAIADYSGVMEKVVEETAVERVSGVSEVERLFGEREYEYNDSDSDDRGVSIWV